MLIMNQFLNIGFYLLFCFVEGRKTRCQKNTDKCKWKFVFLLKDELDFAAVTMSLLAGIKHLFLDKDDNPLTPSCNSSVFVTLGDVKEPTHCSKRVGHGVPVLWLAFISHGCRNLSRDHSSWLTLLLCPCQKVAKLNK